MLSPQVVAECREVTLEATAIAAESQAQYGLLQEGVARVSQQVPLLWDRLRLACDRVMPVLTEALQPREGKLVLSSNWLNAWLVVQCLTPEFCNDYCDPQSATSLASLRVLRALSTSLSDTLPWLVWSRLGEDDRRNQAIPLPRAPWSEVDKSRLCLLCEKALHQGAPHDAALRAAVESLYAVEMISYSAVAGGGWRQHLFHVQDVAMLGAVLLVTRPQDSLMTLAERLVQLSGTSDSRTLLAQWYTAALSHDIYAGGKAALQAGEVLSHATEWNGGDHDSLGGQHWRELAGRRPGLEDFLEEVAAAIEGHHSDNPVAASRTPLLYLLVICDNLHEGERPRLHARRLAESFGAAIRHGRFDTFDRRALYSLTPSWELGLVAAEVTPDGSVRIPEERMHFVVEVSEGPAEGLSEPALAWVDLLRALSRLRPDPDYGRARIAQSGEWDQGRSLRMRVDFLSRFYSGDELPQMEYLDEFCRENESAFGGLRPALAAALTGAKGLRYEQSTPSSTGEAIEQLRFDVPELSLHWRPEAIPAVPFADYHRWRVERERRRAVSSRL